MACHGYVVHSIALAQLTVTELASKSLLDVTRDNPENLEQNMLKYLVDISLGMNYCHLRGIIHRDMNLGNFLIGKDQRVKVSDFGLGKIHVSDNHSASYSKDRGAALFRAPEVRTSSKYDRKCDVWSFGIVMWSLKNHNIKDDNRVKQYQFEEGSEDLIKKMKSIMGAEFAPFGQRRMGAMRDVSPEFREIVESCLRLDPKKRPEFYEIVKLLSAIKKD